MISSSHSGFGSGLRRSFGSGLRRSFGSGWLAWLCALLFVAGAGVDLVYAQDQMPPAPYAYQELAEPKREAQARALMETLRCLVCQGQSIIDSDAPLAGDMRHEVRIKIAAGETPEAVRAWLIARYGKWVSYDPPFDATTALLWLAPVIFLGAGLVIASGRFRSPRRATALKARAMKEK